MALLIGFGISIVVIALLYFIGLPALKRYNLREKEAERKWTDPKYHD